MRGAIAVAAEQGAAVGLRWGACEWHNGASQGRAVQHQAAITACISLCEAFANRTHPTFHAAPCSSQGAGGQAIRPHTQCERRAGKKRTCSRHAERHQAVQQAGRQLLAVHGVCCKTCSLQTNLPGEPGGPQTCSGRRSSCCQDAKTIVQLASTCLRCRTETQRQSAAEATQPAVQAARSG